MTYVDFAKLVEVNSGNGISTTYTVFTMGRATGFLSEKGPFGGKIGTSKADNDGVKSDCLFLLSDFLYV